MVFVGAKRYESGSLAFLVVSFDPHKFGLRRSVFLVLLRGFESPRSCRGSLAVQLTVRRGVIPLQISVSRPTT